MERKKSDGFTNESVTYLLTERRGHNSVPTRVLFASQRLLLECALHWVCLRSTQINQRQHHLIQFTSFRSHFHSLCLIRRLKFRLYLNIHCTTMPASNWQNCASNWISIILFITEIVHTYPFEMCVFCISLSFVSNQIRIIKR